MVISGVALLYFSSIPLIGNALFRLIEGGQERSPATFAPNADAIIVLSGTLRAPRGKFRISEWGDPNRFFGGLELLNAGKAPLLIFTGGWLPWEPDAPLEGDVLAKFAGDLGVPKSAMRVTGKVSNTAEEAKAVVELLNADQPTLRTKPKILLVTSAFHMARAKAIFERSGLEVFPFPVDFQVSTTKKLTPADFFPSPGSLSATEAAIREFYGRLYYRVRL